MQETTTTDLRQQPNAVRLHANDDVVIARRQLVSGAIVEDGVVVSGLVPPGHKVASRDIAEKEPVRRYNQIIGAATRRIRRGEHVHTHNMGMVEFAREYAFCADARPTTLSEESSFFNGIIRPDGQVATRNYVGIVTSVNCSATVARAIADAFRRDIHPDVLADFPNVDGVVALAHGYGCGIDANGEGIKLLRRTIAGYAVHPNMAATILIGLGCESNQIDDIVRIHGLHRTGKLRTYTIQDVGGTTRAIERGIQLVKEILPDANRVERTRVHARHLVVGLQCGGSDGYSGITANPALGSAVDLLVRQGGTAILSETPEIYGAEHLLTRRAVTREVGEKLVRRIEWWKSYCERNGGELDNNPSAGNKAGGLTTVLEKSLGGVAKGGTTNLIDVYEYAEPVTASGLVFMDTPGFDPISATGQVAGGANLICFTTGRGSAYGCAPTPSIKLGTNTDLWRRQSDDIDINCGEILDGDSDVEEMGRRIFRRMLDCASGERSRSETHGYGQSEFVPWPLGVIA